jgi:hypothetical protein
MYNMVNSCITNANKRKLKQETYFNYYLLSLIFLRISNYDNTIILKEKKTHSSL